MTSLFFSLLFLPTSCVSISKKASADLPYFDSLNDWLYRGGQPTEEGFRQLKEKGIRTIVNFRNEPEWIRREKKRVEGLGMKYVNLPWTLWGSVNPELLNQFFETLDRPENRPVFFHCKHGRDRTGVMTTLALMRYEKLSECEARKRALKKIKPNLRYRYFVNQKIEFFLQKDPQSLKAVEKLSPSSESSDQGG